MQCLAIVKATGNTQTEAGLGPGEFLFIGGSVAILLYTIIPLGCFKSFARFNQLTEPEALDTGGITFAEASTKDPILCMRCVALQDRAQ